MTVGSLGAARIAVRVHEAHRSCSTMKALPVLRIATSVTALLVLGTVSRITVQARVAAETAKSPGNISAQDEYVPAYCCANHDVGRITLLVENSGTNGGAAPWAPALDCITGETVGFNCEYPRDSRVDYMYAWGVWVGAIVSRDTLVSTGHDGWYLAFEMAPDISPFGDIVYRSIINPDDPEYDEAISEQDLICTYTDTFTTDTRSQQPDVISGRPHTPLGIRVDQRSYAWSYSYAEDFILFDMSLTNIGSDRLEDVYFALYVDADVGFNGGGSGDDLCGFLGALSSFEGCGFVDTVNVAWIADNDGDPVNGVFIDAPILGPDMTPMSSAPDVTGICILEPPSEYLDLSFNWWIGNMDPTYDFGPRRRDDFRDFKTGGLGTPEGDANKYYQMSNCEFDYDQAFTASITPYDDVWMYPNQELAADFADGYDTRYLLSYGAFNLDPGQMVPLTFAYVAGEDFHTDPGNLRHLPDDPMRFYASLDFSDLAKNSVWARWIYDNPGYDTDGDGYCGESRVCVYDSVDTDSGWIATVAETTWHWGDGVPDFRGASPPPAPDFWVSPIADGLRIRFNGHRSETEKDIFSHQVDFEGYRIYMGRDEREASYSLVASYDRLNFDKYVWNDERQPYPGWELRDVPFNLDSLRCLYGTGDDPCEDVDFDPLSYTSGSFYQHPEYPDSIFYFLPHDHNGSIPGVTTDIHKLYPDEPDPHNLPPDSLTSDRYTEDGYLKFYEYGYVIEGLLPSVPYWVNVTAFDHGSPMSDLDALETSVTLGATCAYPSGPALANGAEGDQAYVYPNPYRIDADYRMRGLEGRANPERPDYRVRAVHFANLPPKCTIRIFSLDGDLVRELDHDVPETDGTSRHHTWDLITRNTQMVVTGIYYWTVESPDGSVQVGKLVVLF